MPSSVRELIRLAQTCLDQALEHVRHSDLAQAQWAQFSLADMATDIQVARLLADQDETGTKALLQAKETAARTARRALHLMGEQAVDQLPFQAILRLETRAGAPDEQRIRIARELLNP